MKKTSTDSTTPATFDEYVDLNTYQDDLTQIGINPAEWNADNFLDDRKYMNRAREILRTNPNISPVDAEMKIMAIRAAIRKCAITDVEKRETYNTELHAYKLLKDWLMNNYSGNKKMKNISENKNMKKNAVKINENALRQMIAESVKKVLKEHAWTSAPTFKELQNVLDKVTEILREFSNNIPQEHSDEFMKLVGREWNTLWESLSSIEETVMHINNPRGLSDSDLTFDDLS